MNILLRLTVVLTTFVFANTAQLRWASSGGGWRSMITNNGYIHAFEKAGLVSSANCEFTAMSFNSGASWFASQLVYSEQYFSNVVGDDVTPDSIRQFSLAWLNDYEQYLDSTSSFFCNALSGFGLIAALAGISDTCNTAFRGSWYEFILGMLDSAASNVYGDSGFAERTMNSGSRLSAFGNTNIMMQTGLSESSRYSSGSVGLLRNSFVTLEGADRLLAVPLSAQYTVTSSQTSFRYGIEEGETIITCHNPGQNFFSFNAWNDWYRHPAEGVTDIFSQRSVDSCISTSFSPPFNNQGTVAQITAASSANLASRSGSVPVFLFHHYSVALSDAAGLLGRLAVNLQVMIEYLFPPFFNNAVCSQVPVDCGPADGRLIDGGFTDGPSKCEHLRSCRFLAHNECQLTLYREQPQAWHKTLATFTLSKEETKLKRSK